MKTTLLCAILKMRAVSCCFCSWKRCVRAFTAATTHGDCCDNRNGDDERDNHASRMTQKTACVVNPSPLTVGAYQNEHSVHFESAAAVQCVMFVKWVHTPPARTWSVTFML